MEDINYWQTKFESCQYSDRLIDKLTLINKTVKNSVDIQEVKKAIYYAKKYHGDQMRESGEPYYSHPLEVAYMLAEYGEKEDIRYFRTNLLVVAILHDVIEDTELTEQVIEGIFGEYVAKSVEGLTRIKIDKKISSVEALNLLFSQNKKDVLCIKLLDRLHNIKTIEAKAPEKIKKIIDETLLYFIAFAAYLEMRSVEEELTNVCHQKLNKFKLLKREEITDPMKKCFLLNSQEIQNILHSSKKTTQPAA